MKKISKVIVSILLLMLFAVLAQGQGKEHDKLSIALSYFTELDSLCKVDNGRMWGVNLYGATMFVAPQSRLIIANEPDAKGLLTYQNGVYVGELPVDINIANTSFRWNGKRWTMVSWDAIPANDAYSRRKLLIHESWHRIQEDIGIMPTMTMNSHLDEKQGSILLKLEFLALINALGDEVNVLKHLQNALTIRAYRQSIFPENNENLFEIHEGMPEYTGFKLCGLDHEITRKIVAKQLEIALGKEGLANSFAYITGPAYGLILDGLDDNWLIGVKNGNSIPEIGSPLLASNISSDTNDLQASVDKIITEYGAETLIEAEISRFKSQQNLIAEYQQKFAKGNILLIKNDKLQFSFNPQEKLVPIDNGVVYKTMRLTGEWGVVEVRNGIFRSKDWQLFILAAPTSGQSGSIAETDYDLMLNEGWEVVLVGDGKFKLSKR
ncbi:MAG: hypothetical protein RBT74_00380 [Tenuifilaceae bacterium]|jgi:hypothetical protein|nr:hypothetical protein [Tenuifilaceae bacterium]